MDKKKRAALVAEKLAELYPEALCELKYDTDYQLFLPHGFRPSVPTSASTKSRRYFLQSTPLWNLLLRQTSATLKALYIPAAFSEVRHPTS
jgi:hypothetical protein